MANFISFNADEALDAATRLGSFAAEIENQQRNRTDSAIGLMERGRSGGILILMIPNL